MCANEVIFCTSEFTIFIKHESLTAKGSSHMVPNFRFEFSGLMACLPALSVQCSIASPLFRPDLSSPLIKDYVSVGLASTPKFCSLTSQSRLLLTHSTVENSFKFRPGEIFIPVLSHRALKPYRAYRLPIELFR